MKQKDFPKEIEVADGIFYKVKFKRGLEKKGYLGLCFYDLKEIWVSTGLGEKERMDTFFHEAIHAIDFEWELKLDHSMVYKLERPLAFLLSRNSVFIKWSDAK